MNPDEHKAAAQKLTSAIKNNTNGAYDEWVSHGTKLNDPAARAAFVQKHAGLVSTPTTDDMQAMHQHVNASLQKET